MINNFFAIWSIFVLQSDFLTKLLRLGILFSLPIRTVVVVVAANSVILGILLLTSFILALREALVNESIILGISPLIPFILY